MKSREEIERDIAVYERRQKELRLADVLERERLKTSWFWLHRPKQTDRPAIWDNAKGKWFL